MSDVNKEKRAEIIQDALDYLDDDMIERVDMLRMQAQKVEEPYRNNKKRIFYNHRILAMAASVCLLIMGAFAWENFIGPPDAQNGVLRGTESGDMDQAPENAPGLDEDMVCGTEYNPSDVTQESSDSKNTQEKEPETNSDAPSLSGPEETIEPELYAPLGDAYQLKNNYVKVTILPHKVWSEEADLQAVLSKSVEISSEYKGEFDQLVEALCDTPRLEVIRVPEVKYPEADVTYHLFFHKEDGEVVHVWMFEDGYAYYDEEKEYCMKIDRAVYATIYKLLALYW